MTEFKRNKDGILQAYRDGKYVGDVITMGDEVKNGNKDRKRQDRRMS